MQNNTARNCQPNIALEVWGLTDFLLKTRLTQALEAGVSRYPVHRTLRFAARREHTHCITGGRFAEMAAARTKKK